MKRDWMRWGFVAATFIVGLVLRHHAGWVVPAMAMGITFNSIPNNLRVPFVAVEFDNSQATLGPVQLNYQVLIIAQKTSAGTGVANSINLVGGADDCKRLGGVGSQAHRMGMAYFAENQFTTTYLALLADNGTTYATGSLAFTGPASAAGTLSLYIAGQLLSVPVASGASATTVGAAVAAAINANTSLPVTATASTGTVTVTANNAGTVGNYIDMRFNYQVGQAFPAGIACTITAMASGATDPVLTTLIANMGDNWYQIVAHPYAQSATALTALENELARRAGPLVMADGLGISSASGTQATLVTLGTGRNSQYNCILAQGGQNPLTPPEEFAASSAGSVAFNGAIDPARPFQTLPLTWPLPVTNNADVFTLGERNTLLFDGIATTKVGPSGQVQLERIITTYQKNAASTADASYLDATTILTLLYLRYSFGAMVTSKCPRSKLAADGTRFGPGQPVVTPSVMKAMALGWFMEMEKAGLVQDFNAFKSALVVQINGSNPNRIDVLLPPDLIGQLITTAAQIQFGL